MIERYSLARSLSCESRTKFGKASITGPTTFDIASKPPRNAPVAASPAPATAPIGFPWLASARPLASSCVRSMTHGIALAMLSPVPIEPSALVNEPKMSPCEDGRSFWTGGTVGMDTLGFENGSEKSNRSGGAAAPGAAPSPAVADPPAPNRLPDARGAPGFENDRGWGGRHALIFGAATRGAVGAREVVVPAGHARPKPRRRAPGAVRRRWSSAGSRSTWLPS